MYMGVGSGCVCGWLVGWLVCARLLVCAFVCAFVSAFVCSFRGLFACVLSWVVHVHGALGARARVSTPCEPMAKPTRRTNSQLALCLLVLVGADALQWKLQVGSRLLSSLLLRVV